MLLTILARNALLFIAYFAVYALADFPFRDVTLPWDKRVEDLVNRLTLDEVVDQLARGGAGTNGPASPISRLGIKPFQWDTECLRGMAFTGSATAFPQSINLGATFSWRLMESVAQVIGIEVRAKVNNYTAHGEYGDHQGLNCFAPMINMMRHPLWGRNQEVYGEDPHLTGRLAQAYVKGIQGDDDRYVQAASSCKAFLGYAGPENIPVSRLTFDAKIPERDLRLTYLPAFKACAEAGTYSYMCSYNSVNGKPMCTNKRILTEILRNEYGFEGFVISDMGAIEAVVETHHYLNNTLDTIVATMNAGCNLELANIDAFAYYTKIGDAVGKGMILEETVRDLLKPLFYTRMRLGEFDPPEMNFYNKFDISVVQSPAHRQLALKAAMKSFVLLKNNGLLPLKKKFSKIAVVGPMATNYVDLYGDYNADVDMKYASSPLAGLKPLSDTVQYGAGCPDNPCTNYTRSEVVDAVQGAQLVVVTLGTGVGVECEAKDRANMSLPGYQEQILKDVMANTKGAPIILLLFSAGPLNVTFADENSQIDAIMQCFFPAQTAGEAIYNTLTMATPDASPAGRLPYTWYKTADQIPSMVDYSMSNRTYRYFGGEPAYPFGYGLSYTSFSYGNLVYDAIITKGLQYVLVKAEVTNTGSYGSDEVGQVYISWMTTQEVMPQLQLVAFDRIFIEAGHTEVFTFKINIDKFAVWNEVNGFFIEKGDIMLYVGGQQPGQKRSLSSNILQGKIQVEDTFGIGTGNKKSRD